MKKGKYLRKTPANKRRLIPVLCLCLSLTLALTVLTGTTLAWLTDRTDPLVSTFTVGTIDISLSQTTDAATLLLGQSAQHDAKVTVAANSEKCYVFVEIQAVSMTYESKEGWTPLEGAEGVYYCIAESSTADQDIAIFQSVTAGEGETHTLTVTAYACQYTKDNSETFTPAEAWAIAKPATT